VTDRKADTTKLDALAASLPDSLRVVKRPAEALVHRAYAGADWLLAAHREEATGTVARLAQRYGTAPIVRAVGAFADIVVDADATCETGTGFTFVEGTPEALTAACQRARHGYGTLAAARLRRRMLRLDRGWDRAARLHDRVLKAITQPS
jgi:starch synthase